MLNLLTRLYKTTKESGFLESRLGKTLFRNAYFLYKKHLEDFYVPLLKQHPQMLRGGHIVDVGANIGYTTILFSKYIEPGFKIFAIEPHPANFQHLQENIARYKIEDKVVLIQAAVGDSSGEIQLWQNETSHADHRILTSSLNETMAEKSFKSLRVPLITLDDLSREYNLGRSIKFIKVDVQGYELPVIKGMTELLRENPDLRVCLEYDPQMMNEMGFESEKVFDYFENYFKYLITSKGLKKIVDGTEVNEIELDKGYADILFSKQLL